MAFSLQIWRRLPCAGNAVFSSTATRMATHCETISTCIIHWSNWPTLSIGQPLTASPPSRFSPVRGGQACGHGLLPAFCHSSMHSISPMNRSSPAGWRTRTGRRSPARRICRPSHPSTRQACPAGASAWAKSAWRNCWRRASRPRNAPM